MKFFSIGKTHHFNGAMKAGVFKICFFKYFLYIYRGGLPLCRVKVSGYTMLPKAR